MAGFTLACIPASLVGQRPPSHIADFVEYQTPDAICLVGTSSHPKARMVLQQALDDPLPVIFPTTERGSKGLSIGGLDVLVIGDRATESDIPSEASMADVVITNKLALSVDANRLETTLDVIGDMDWPPTQLADDAVVLSGRIEGDYEQRWHQQVVHGIAPVPDANGSGVSLPYVTVTDDRMVSTTFLSSEKLGLRAIHGVGRAKEETLEDNGYETREALAAASESELKEIRGIGQKTATQYVTHADALSNERVVRTSDEEVPVSDPVFIDIETDGLNPSIIWQIGAYDQLEDEYETFLQTDPDEPGKAVREFMEWLDARPNNAIVAWNGYGFDFPHLEQFIVKYAPEYETSWGRTYRFDPLRWCRDKNNAVLPGRSNKLDTVGAALGYDRADTGLDGEQVGKLYRRWMATQSDEAELDWERHIQYCKDDVYGLAHVFNEIVAAGSPSSSPSTTQTDAESGADTTQGKLTDY